MVRFAPDGKLRLVAEKVVSNTRTNLSSEKLVPGVTHAANAFYWIRMQVVGSDPTTIQIKAWADGQTEPASWMYTITDSTSALQTAGAVGLQGYLATAATNAPVVFSFDDYRVVAAQ